MFRVIPIKIAKKRMMMSNNGSSSFIFLFQSIKNVGWVSFTNPAFNATDSESWVDKANPAYELLFLLPQTPKLPFFPGTQKKESKKDGYVQDTTNQNRQNHQNNRRGNEFSH
jgi:hypothetical protein